MAQGSKPDGERSERVIIGRAIAAVRVAARLSQQRAADNAIPRMTPQNWGLHETGKVAGVEKLSVQKRMVEALGASLDDLAEARRHIEAEYDAQPAPGARLRALAGGLSQTDARSEPRAFGQGVRRYEFPLSEGQAVLLFPDGLSADGFRELADYLAVFLRTNGQELTAPR